MYSKGNIKINVVLVVFLLCMLAIPTIVQASLVAQYHLNTGSGTTASDTSGNNNTGTISGAAWVQLPGGGYCLSFDGINDYIDCGNGASLNLTNAVSMVAWVCPWVSSGAEAGICGKGYTAANSRYLLTYYANNSYWFYIDSGSENVNTLVSPGAWNQIAVTYNRASMCIYVNGVLKGQKSLSEYIDSGSNFYIGATNGSTLTGPFKGLIDEVSVYNNALSATDVANLYSSSTRNNYNNMTALNGVEDGQVAHYACNEGTSSTVNDSSGFLNTGTAYNCTWSANTSPNYGYSLSFNGTSSYVDCGSKNSLDINGPITVMAWINPTTLPYGEVGILGKGFDSYLLTYYTNGRVYWYINSGGNNVNTSISTNTWSHVAATYDKQNLKLYVNGTLVSTSSTYTAAIASGGTFNLGRIGTSSYFNGRIDEVRVYNKALSAADISARYTEDSASRNGLVAHYLLNKDTGGKIADVSGRGNTGTLTGCRWDEGSAGTALYFSAGTITNDYVDCGNSSSLDITGPISVAAWVRPETFQQSTADYAIVGKDMSSYLLTYCYNTSYFWYINSGSNQISASIGSGTWARVVSTFDGTYLKIYVNGSLVQQRTSSYPTIAQGGNLYLGCAGVSGGVPQIPFRGHLSDVKIYNRALSPSEVSSDYQSSVVPTVRLNSLVTELVNKISVPAGTYYWYYNVPYNGWIYFKNNATLSGNSQVTVDDYFNNNNLNVITQTSSSDAVVENMRFLSAGTHLLTVTVTGTGTLNTFTVRTIPELIFCQYQAPAIVSSYGSYDWEWLSDNGILDNVNTIITSSSHFSPLDSNFQDWHDQGKRLISDTTNPYLLDPPLPLEEVYPYWWNNNGFQSSLGNGIIVDEFLEGATNTIYDDFDDIVVDIYNNSGASGKVFYIYGAGDYNWDNQPGNGFIETIFNRGGAIARECYLTEPPTASEADNNFTASMMVDFQSCSSYFPETYRHWITNIGYMSAPNEFMDVDPAVDFKAFLDREVNQLATEPVFNDLYGMTMYLARYTDEETVRWASKLYRYYGIEGNRGVLHYALNYPYNPNILQNPDFESGSDYWYVEPAQTGSITTGSLSRWGYLQGRCPRFYGDTKGDTYICTTRCSNDANYIEQALTGLTVGQWYSIKMFAADYDDMYNGISSSKDLGIRFSIWSGGTVDTSKTFKEIVYSVYDRSARGFTGNSPAYMNYFRTVFQATDTEAYLVISDWFDANTPGGPIGQRIMYNYLECQPYYNN